ncbi:unnamed protein product [Cuscuta campestris]|uniref:Uncharacterized protein n=1 Tax=Cuscuta campestris TaxID=132261 RepID=A0A484KEP6_9ASTE|nr:unnamed protein product [Cuscuta campestris]
MDMGQPHYGNGPAVEYTFCLVWGVLCNHLRRKVIPYKATGRCWTVMEDLLLLTAAHILRRYGNGLPDLLSCGNGAFVVYLFCYVLGIRFALILVERTLE